MPDIVDASQACEMLGIGKKKLYALIASHELNVMKDGRKNILPKVCVMDYMENNMKG